jgi:hypothetical protein
MNGETSIGPEEPLPTAGKAQATVEGVDALNANEFDVVHALAGAETKPFRSDGAVSESTAPNLESSERQGPGVPQPKVPSPPGGQQGTSADREQQRKKPPGFTSNLQP